MGQKENNLRIESESSLSPYQRLWRANSGQGWIGKILEKGGNYIKLGSPQPFYGMPKGSTDMIGFDSIIITQEMVGKRVAVFVGEELKATKGDKLKKAQRNFKNLLIKLGGIHRLRRPDSVEESGFNIDS
jgi:hypothetical protein